MMELLQQSYIFLFLFFFIFFFFLLQNWSAHAVSHMLVKSSTTELHPQLYLYFLI
jgi:hypothetical protein